MAMSNDTTSLEDFRQEARDWIKAHLAPVDDPSVRRGMESKTPEEIAASRKLQRKLFEAGFAGISYPKAYGGRGLTEAHDQVWRQETVGYVTPDFGGAGHVMFGAIGRSLLAHCTPAFLEARIPKMLSGEELWCQFYSEPEAGSDLAGIRTRATRDGDQWIINGSKIWSTGANHADWAMCLARTDWDVAKHRGLTWFAVPTSTKGVTIRPITQVNGESGFCEEFLDDVVISDANVIGEVNAGWTVTQTMLVYERGAGQSGAAPLEPRALAPDMVELARRVGRLDDPSARQAIAQAHINDTAQYHLGRRVFARLTASSEPQPAIASYGKLASGTFAPIRAQLGLDIAGAEALVWGHGDGLPEETINFLNGRMGSIAAGTNEMMRNGIGERVLGLPREPSFDSQKPFAEVLRDARSWNGKVG
jgi:alkylation response protein AidB-like acyl-CoA dehydrogenase